MSISLDDSTTASHPGQTKISAEKFLEFYSVHGVKRIYYSLLFKQSLEFLSKISGDSGFISQWIRTVEQFQFGCLNASTIINVENGLIASYTDLRSYGDNPTHAIKITRQRLDLIENKELFNGMKLPAVSVYMRDPNDPEADSWIDFCPLAAHCFSDDQVACDKLLNQFDDEDWRNLNQGLAQIGNHNKPGLYHIKISNAGF